MNKSLVRQRREAGAVCSKCQSPDYRVERNPPLKPTITCNSCGNQWQYGYDGGIYARLERLPNKEVVE
mgnify:CR=1 FL=1